MNILYICHRIPFPPNKGDKIRSFNQIRDLSKRHTVHLACLVDDPADLQHVTALRKYCASVEAVYRGKMAARGLALLALFTGESLSVAAFYSRELKRRIDEKIRSERFDSIFVFCSSMAGYVADISDIPKVIDFVDVDSDKWRLYADFHPFPVSWIYRREADRLAQYEEVVARQFDRSIFVSKKEVDLFQKRVSDRSISAIPNGVDLDYFYPRVDDTLSTEPPMIVFTGAMDYFPNVDAVRYFCAEIFPKVRKVLPDLLFYIVGRNPVSSVRALGSQENVIVTGTVSDVRPYLAKAKVAVAPFRIARGIQNKILEAMAMGLPVIGTSIAFQGIEEKGETGCLSAEDPDAFVRALLLLLQDQPLRSQCGRQGRSFVERFYRWQDHGERLESLLLEATGTYPAGQDIIERSHQASWTI
jgi:sugar transferase (PEP-CTERM/EpsH1 system associated)